MSAIAEQFSEFVSDTSGIPESARQAALRCILDLLACAVGGFSTQGASAAREGAMLTWGSGTKSIWFTGQSLQSAGAAFANSAMACQLDLDDGHRAAAGHPAACIIPAAFAAFDPQFNSTDDLLVAICLGYELAIRVAASRDLHSIPTTDSGIWCGLGAVTAIGHLLRMPAGKVAQALAICGTTSPAQSATSYTRFMGNNVKEGIPFAGANAFTSTNLAQCGFTGPIDIFDANSGYDRRRLLAGLGTTWLIESTYFKPYSACRWCHAPVDALLDLLAQNSILPDQIEKIEVATFSRALSLNNEIRPTVLESAQYSIPFCLGLAATEGADSLLLMQEKSLNNKSAQNIAAKVHLSIDEKLNSMFSEFVPARVTLFAHGQEFSKTVTTPKGEHTNPLSGAELEAKLHRIGTATGAPQLADALWVAFKQFESGNLSTLTELLGRPAFATVPIRKGAAI
jgi:2-methylcitrate dehydratase PrpD